MDNLGPNATRVLQYKDASFELVVWNPEEPPLNSELNLLQSIQSEAHTKLFLAALRSGVSQIFSPAENISTPNSYFVHVGDPDTMVYAVVNGMVLSLGAVNDSNINKIKLTLSPPTSSVRTDFVFLEVWRALLVPDSADNKPSEDYIYRYGNTQFVEGPSTPAIPEEAIDPEIEFATTYRVQYQYRFRVVSDLNFTLYEDGFSSPTVSPRGTSSTEVGDFSFELLPGETCVYRAGDGDSDNALGTVDGYSYAIPIQKVTRRASGDANDTVVQLSDIENLMCSIDVRGAGKTDHGELTGLEDDDHLQYLTTGRHAALSHSFVDHGALGGLDTDDHPQYYLIDGSKTITGSVLIGGDRPEILFGGDTTWSIVSDPDEDNRLQIFNDSTAMMVINPSTVLNPGLVTLKGSMQIIPDLSGVSYVQFSDSAQPWSWFIQTQSIGMPAGGSHEASTDSLCLSSDKSGSITTAIRVTPDGEILGNGSTPVAVNQVIVKTHTHDGTAAGGETIPVANIDGALLGFTIGSDTVNPSSGRITLVGSGITIQQSTPGVITFIGGSSGATAVTKIIPGTGLVVSPSSGLGNVTITPDIGNYLEFQSNKINVKVTSGANPSQANTVVKGDDTRWATLVGGPSSNADSYHTHALTSGAQYKINGTKTTSSTAVSSTDWVTLSSITLTGIVATHRILASVTAAMVSSSSSSLSGNLRILIGGDDGGTIPLYLSSGDGSERLDVFTLGTIPISGKTGTVTITAEARNLGSSEFFIRERTLSAWAAIPS